MPQVGPMTMCVNSTTRRPARGKDALLLLFLFSMNLCNVEQAHGFACKRCPWSAYSCLLHQAIGREPLLDESGNLI